MQQHTWISRCLVAQLDPEGIIKNYTIQVACNASDEVDLHHQIRAHLQNNNFTLKSIEYTRLIQEHLDRMDYYDQVSINLSAEAARHGYALGQLDPIKEQSSSINAEGPSYLNIQSQPMEFSINPEKPSWQQPWIDPSLKQTLFKSDTKTYLLLDATSRGIISKTFDLDDYNDIDKCSLYSGQLAEDLKQQAPYLLDVTLNEDQLMDDSSVPKFHRDFFSKYWGKNTGIFIHSSEPLDKLNFHLKKFTKVQDETGKWFFFRFFDPRIMAHYLESIQRWPQRIAKWYGAQKNSQLIQGFICEHMAGNEYKVFQLKPNHGLTHSGNIKLTHNEFDLFSDYQWQQTKNLVEIELRQDFPKETIDITNDDINDWLETAANKGYTTPRALYDYSYSVLMALTYGFDLSEIEQYLTEQTTSHLEKSKLLYLSTKDAVERYAPGSNT